MSSYVHMWCVCACGLSVGLAVWWRRLREFLHVLHVNTQLLLLMMLLLMLQCASSTAESWWRHAVRRLTEGYLWSGAPSTAPVGSSRRRIQHEVNGKRKYDGRVLFSGDLWHGLQVAQLQRVGRFIDHVRRLFESVRCLLFSFRRYDLQITQYAYLTTGTSITLVYCNTTNCKQFSYECYQKIAPSIDTFCCFYSKALQEAVFTARQHSLLCRALY